MRIRFSLDGVEHLGETQELSTFGAFVVAESLELPERLDLCLGAGEDSLTLSGEVLRITPQGFAVAFSALTPDAVVHLDRLLHPEKKKAPETTQSKEATGGIQVRGQDWSPPVSEPALHDWKPETDLVPPPPGKPDRPSWGLLPTLSPKATIEPLRPAPVAEEFPPAAPPQPVPEQPAPEQFAPAKTRAPAPAPQPPKEENEPQAPQVQPPPQSEAEEEEEAAGVDRRRFERVDKSIPVTFDTLTSLIKEFTHNISFGGLFVYTSRPTRKGEDVAITLVHPVHDERLTLLGKVVHSGAAPTPDPVTGQQRYGVGVEFRMPLVELKRLLSDFISSHQKPSVDSGSTSVVQEAKAILGRGTNSSHELLGIAPDSKREVIRRTYFQMVDRFHPDRHFGKINRSDQKVLEELFRQLTKAYEELTQ